MRGFENMRVINLQSMDPKVWIPKYGFPKSGTNRVLYKMKINNDKGYIDLGGEFG